MPRRFLLALLLSLYALGLQAATRPNIFLITLDSTRADSVGYLGARKGATPNLDRAAAEAVVFEHAYAQVPLSVPSHATILTGLYPQAHQVSGIGMPLPASAPFLPDLLRAKGYHTAAFVGSSELDPRTGLAPGFSRGFERYEAPREAQHEDALGKRAEWRPEEVVRRASAWLAANSRGPLFVWLSLYPGGPGTYSKQVAGLDAGVGKLVQALKAQKLYNDALIIVVADHGEALGAHGEQGHGVFLYDDTIRVPLLLKPPRGDMAGRKVSTRVSLVDIASSVLEVAELPVPPQMQGQSLLRIVKSRSGADQPVYSRTDFPSQDFGWSALESWRSGNYLLIRAPRPELYDVAADPGAMHNLAESRKAVLNTLSAQLENFDRRITTGTSAVNATGLTNSELQKLSSLGYVGLQHPANQQTSTPTGTDPKDEIEVANRVESAVTLLESGKAAQAVTAFDAITAAHPKIYLASYGAGVARIVLKQYKGAMEALHTAIALRPDSVLAHYAMGIATSRSGDWKTAATHLEITAARLPESFFPHELLAEAYTHLGRSADAAREKSKAMQLRSQRS